MLGKAQRINDWLDNISFGSLLKHKCLRHINKFYSFITWIQTSEYNVEHSSTVKFLLSDKKFNQDLKKIECNPFIVYHGKHSKTEALIEKDVIMFLCGIHTTEKGIRKAQNKSILKLMSSGAT